MALPASALALMRAPAPATGVVPPGVLPVGEWDAALPDGGLPRGAVLEVASPFGLGRSTSLAVAACAAAQRASATWLARSSSSSASTSASMSASMARSGGASAWCAWLDPWGTLNAPGVRDGGVDLERLLVVRPTAAMLARAAVRVASSGTFAVVVVDAVVPLAPCNGRPCNGRDGDEKEGEIRLERWPTVVRRLALAVEGTETTVLLLTDLGAARGLPLPVAMRLELDRRVVETDIPRDGVGISGWRSYLRVAKDRHGRVGVAQALG